MTYKKIATLIGLGGIPPTKQPEKQPEPKPYSTPWDVKLIKPTPAPKENYESIEIKKAPEDDMVPDPFFDQEATDLLDNIIESEGGEVSFQQTWKFSKGAILETLEEKTYTDRLFQMLEMAKSAKAEDLPMDFVDAFDRLFERYVAEVANDIITYGDLEHAYQAIESVRPYINLPVINLNAFLRIVNLYNQTVEEEARLDELELQFGEILDNVTPEEAEKNVDLYMQFGEVVEIQGPDVLADVYQDVIDRMKDNF